VASSKAGVGCFIGDYFVGALDYADDIVLLVPLSSANERSRMIEVFKIVYGYYDNISRIYLLPHVDVATRGNKYKLYQSHVKYDLQSTFSLTEWCHYGIACLMVLWTLIL